MLTRTKIICTIGPAVESLDKMLQLIDAGMNVARLNFSHGTHQEHLERIQNLKKAREMREIPLAIMLDTKGPEIRLGKMKGDGVHLEKGQKLLLVGEAVEGTNERMQITPALVLEHLKEGIKILFDDGYIAAKVVEATSEGVLVEIQNEGTLKSHKGVNVPGVFIDLPAMTEQDIKDIMFGCEQDIDLIAASFVRSADHVREIKRLLIEQGKPETLVIAKIENLQGVQNVDSVIQVADGIMVARGDLGVELPLNQVPILQKMMIRKCYQAGKPVVTATQMLESMIKNPRPTRAEVSDVANAIYDSTSAVMLSGETAVGQYAIETVEMMKSIIEETERDFPYKEFFQKEAQSDYRDISASISLASVKTAYSAGAKAIFTFSMSGCTPRLISRFRPQMPIFALTPSVKSYHQMALLWGIHPAPPQKAEDEDEGFHILRAFCMKKGVLEYGDLVVLTAGTPFGVSGSTNMMMVESIGDVLVRGKAVEGQKVQGKVAIVVSKADLRKKDLKERIVVLVRCDDTYANFLKEATGIVLQNYPRDEESEKKAQHIAKTLGLALIVRADGAVNTLQEGQVVILDAERGIVYKEGFDELSL